MPSGVFTMHDDLLQSSNSKVTDSVVMPAVTAQAPTFSRPPMHNPPIESKDLQKDGVNAQSAMHAQYVLQLLQLQRQAGFLCDITIHVKDRSFKAHKSLLAACSLYFRSLFSDPNTKESTALNLVPLTPTGFEVLLDYIYSGNLAITAENSSAVLSAAICLQMTNVVETCKKFMQSSFQMSNCKESPLASLQKDMNSLDYATYFKSNNNSSKYHEDHTSSLYNASDNRTSLQNRAANIEALQRLASPAGTLPSASQLQSVLPILMTNQPRQPTLLEVQNILASIPNAADILAKYPMFSSALKNITSNPVGSFQKFSDESNATVTSVYSSKKPSASINTEQNGHLFKTTPVYSCASSVQDHSTQCSAVSAVKTAEQDCKTDKLSLLNGKTCPTQSISEDASNSIEISSDEESERTAWSTDRSVKLSSDLSGTPCRAVTQVKPTKQSDFAPTSHSNNNNRNNLGVIKKNPVVKTLSLPSLSENTPPAKPLSRARSTEDGDRLGGYSDRSCENASNNQDPMKETEIIDGSSHIEYSEGKSLNEQSSVSEQASDAMSPVNERYAGSISSNSVDDSADENVALDLSVPNTLDINKHLKASDTVLALSMMPKRSESETHAKSSSRRSSAASSFSDPGIQIAIDALEMLKQAKVKEAGMLIDGQNGSTISSDSNSTDFTDGHKDLSYWDDESVSLMNANSATISAKQAMYSRKPRRTADGQMCSWPGCKQVFRHRNMYEEHMKMHKRGAPAAQLRKCYMGARVKKTVREQLEELRSDVFEGEVEGSKLNRARKRKSNSDSQEPLRKRVNVKDRVGNIQFAPSSRSSTSRRPLHQVIHSLSSQSPNLQNGAPGFMRPPPLIPSYVANAKLFQEMRNDGKLLFSQSTGEMATSPIVSQPPALTLVGSPYSLASQRSPTDPSSAYSRIALNSSQMPEVSPIKATLALLGIQTPLLSTDASLASSVAAITATSPIEHYRRRFSVTDTISAKPLAESLLNPHATLAPLSASSGDSNSSGSALGGDFSNRDASRDTSSVSSGSPPAWANNTNPSVNLNR